MARKSAQKARAMPWEQLPRHARASFAKDLAARIKKSGLDSLWRRMLKPGIHGATWSDGYLVSHEPPAFEMFTALNYKIRAAYRSDFPNSYLRSECDVRALLIETDYLQSEIASYLSYKIPREARFSSHLHARDVRFAAIQGGVYLKLPPIGLAKTALAVERARGRSLRSERFLSPKNELLALGLLMEAARTDAECYTVWYFQTSQRCRDLVTGVFSGSNYRLVVEKNGVPCKEKVMRALSDALTERKGKKEPPDSRLDRLVRHMVTMDNLICRLGAPYSGKPKRASKPSKADHNSTPGWLYHGPFIDLCMSIGDSFEIALPSCRDVKRIKAAREALKASPDTRQLETAAALQSEKVTRPLK